MLIAIESSNLLSSDNTGRVLYAIMTYFYGPIDRAWFTHFHHLLRKTGHVIGYGILSILLFRAWKATFLRPVTWAWLWTALAFFGTAFVASMDEWHQSYNPARTGTYKDVILDSAAALGAQILIYLVLRGWRQHTSLRASA